MTVPATNTHPLQLQLIHEGQLVTCEDCAAIRRASFRQASRDPKPPLEALFCRQLKQVVPRGFGCMGFRPASIFDRIAAAPNSVIQPVAASRLECASPNNPDCRCPSCELVAKLDELGPPASSTPDYRSPIRNLEDGTTDPQVS